VPVANRTLARYYQVALMQQLTPALHIKQTSVAGGERGGRWAGSPTIDFL